jgi:AcrR family transcriptional regulator
MRQQQRGEETRACILERAQECFAQKGYDATSVAEICRRAGVTKGALYHHFPSKQSIFMALLEEWLATLDAQLTAIHADASNVPESLLRMAGVAQHVFQGADEQLRLYMEFWTKAGRDPAVKKAIIAPYRRYHKFFSGIIEAGVAEGSLQAVDSGIAAQVIISLAVGSILQRLLDPKGADWGQVVQDGIRMFLEGLEKR